MTKRVFNGARRLVSVAAAAVALVLGIAFAAPSAAFAAAGNPAITYDGAQNTLNIAGGEGSATSTDLFASFKGLVPGDSATQDIDIEFKNVSVDTRLYVQASTAHLTDAQRSVLEEMQLGVSFSGEGIVAEPQAANPSAVFAAEDPVLVARATGALSATMHLTLTIPTSVGNELADLQTVEVPWIITVEEEDGNGGDSTALTPHAMDLIAYEGGVGTNADGSTVGNALPDPVWTNVDWETAAITVDNQPWDEDNPYWGKGTNGLPFLWAYGTIAQDPSLVTTSARAGAYYLLAAPLAGLDGGASPVVTVNGKLLVLPSDYVVTLDDGMSDVIMQVRDVTANEAADALATSHFKDVYGNEGTALSLARLLAAAVPAAYADEPATLSSALDGEFTGIGTHGGACDVSEPHAHVEDGTHFAKNGHDDLPVNDDARIGLLWDDFIPGVLGEERREGVLDAKARAAVGGAFEVEGAAVEHRFKYLDLVDMNDGNLWVATADHSAVTAFVPYFEGIDPEDEIAVVRFDGLTRDYTLDAASADLDALVAGTTAYAVKATKAADGIFFEVPWAEFGPFELLWIDADSGGSGGYQGGSGQGDGDFGGAATDETDRTHDDLLAHTGDYAVFVLVLLVVLAAAIIATGVVLARRRSARR